jgi:hypothetical protein
MAIVSPAMDRFDVSNEWKEHTVDLDFSKKHKMWRLLEQLIALRLIGGEAVSDTPVLKDPAQGALFEW